MAGGEDQNKSEEATSYKLSKAREQGNVARGMDLGFFSSLAAFLFFLSMTGAATAGKLVTLFRRDLGDFRGLEDSRVALALAAHDARIVLGVATLVGVTLLVFVVPLEILQMRGLVFSFQPVKPDWSRLNPAKGLKRLISPLMLKQAIKSILKFTLYSLVVWTVIRSVVATVGREPLSAGQFSAALWHASMKLIAFFTATSLGLAALDQFLSRREFARQMRMSRHEVTREHREREGEPRIKARRKQLHAEFLKQTGGIANLAGSDMLLVNPEHFAVALAYDAETMKAPTVRAKARNQLALAMREQAVRLSIPIVTDPPLARALFRGGALGKEIGSDFYSGVARHYSAQRARNEGRET